MLAALFAAGLCTAMAEAILIDSSQAPNGRSYDGIGGLSNSCAPWLRSFPEQQQQDILDYLFLPGYAASMHILKLEIGGDAHSTINTESSHMHTPDEKPSYNRGWEFWLMDEAKKRNPNIRISALAWGHPFYATTPKAYIAYLVKWVEGAKVHGHNVDALGIQNEAQGFDPIPYVVPLRKALDAAGFKSTRVVCCDSHSFNMLDSLSNQSTELFKDMAILGVHEPLRSSESVPASAIATGKPIWSSESYTTYSDSNGGGCWARALNWGWVLGNVTAHMAWNIIQAYPSVGPGMNYMGHGLMWAEVPWAGHYTVNSPIWVTAHYTQTTEVGWYYLPVGHGSGMLQDGGSFVALVPAPAENSHDFSLVIQTMEHSNSACFKDTHPPFTVLDNQTVTFTLAPPLSATSLFVRRTILHPGDPISPTLDPASLGAKNEYFEPQPNVSVDASSRSFTLTLRINAVYTISTRPSSKGQHTIPATTSFPARYCDSMTAYAVDEQPRYFIDQQGVWEAVPTKGEGNATVVSQVVPREPVEWHSWAKIKHPQSFVGPAAEHGNISCAVRPPVPPSGDESAGGFAGIGFGGQASGKGGGTAPALPMLALYADGRWNDGAGHTGKVTPKAGADGWFALTVEHAAGGAQRAWIDGTPVASFGSSNPRDSALDADADTYTDADAGTGAGASANGGVFAFVASSYSGILNESARQGPGRAPQFRSLCLEITETPVPAPPTPSPPTPPTPPTPPRPTPSPPPPGPKGTLSVGPCAHPATSAQQWVFSGEDGGEAGTLKSAANASLCLDAASSKPPVHPAPCAPQGSKAAALQQWKWDSKSGQLSSVEKQPCQAHSKKGEECTR
jgi:galactosylceramidase